MRVFFGMETPLRERSGGHSGTAPTVSFGGLHVDVAPPTISNIIFLCFTVLTEDKKISKHTYISLRDCYIIAHRNNWYD